jgi:lysophospholipase L1-like esterase
MKLKSVLARVSLVLVSVTATIGVLEVVFRLQNRLSMDVTAERVWKVQSRGMPGENWGYKRTAFGEHEFRETRYASEIFENDHCRILFLGDSFTEGAGILNPADRFTDLIEERLNTEPPMAGRSYHVFNAARGGTEPEEWIEYFRDLVDIYRPHVVFTVFFLRDGTNLATSYYHNKKIFDALHDKYDYVPLKSRSALVNYFYNRKIAGDFSAYMTEKMKSSYLGTEREQKRWRIQQEALRAIATESQERGIDFHLVIFPMLLNLKNYEFDEVEAEIERFAGSEGMSVFSLTPGFEGRNERDLWVANNDQHPNPAGHRVAADTLYPYLADAVESLRSETVD